MSIRRILALACIAAMLTGCTTGYQRMGLTGGYAEQPVADATWHVKFLGNGFTTMETVQTFWLYRCATLTLEKGYQGFEIVKPMPFTLNDFFRANPFAVRTGGGGGGGGFAGALHSMMPDVIGQAAARAAAQPAPTMEGDIHFVNQPFTAIPGKVFDAAALKAILEPLVTGKLCTGNVCPHPHTYIGTAKPAADGQH